MKNNLITMLFISLFVLSLGANASSKISTKDFEINEVEMPTVETATKAWDLKFNCNKDVVIRIEKVDGKNGANYVVYSEYFEIAYANQKKGFGAKKVKASLSKVTPYLTEMVLNQNQIDKQAVLSSSPVSEDEALHLIAGFLPELLKAEYKHLIS